MYYRIYYKNELYHDGKVVNGTYEGTLGTIIKDYVEEEYYNNNFMSNEYNKKRVKYKLGT